MVSGTGSVRHRDGYTPIEAGDAFIFKPVESHEILNDSAQDLVLYVVADNPIREVGFHPDSGKWSVPIPKRMLIRAEAFDYYEGEE